MLGIILAIAVLAGAAAGTYLRNPLRPPAVAVPIALGGMVALQLLADDQAGLAGTVLLGAIAISFALTAPPAEWAKTTHRPQVVTGSS